MHKEPEGPALSVGLLAVLCGAAIGYDWYSYSAPGPIAVPLTFLHAVVLIGIAVFSVRWALYVFVVSLILADDISRLDPYGGYEGLVNLMTVPIAGVALGNYVALGLVALGVLFAALRRTQEAKLWKFTRLDACMCIIVITFLMASLHGFKWFLTNFRGALNDFNLVVMSAGLYTLVRSHINAPVHIIRLWNCIILATAAKAIMWLGFGLLGIGIEFGTTLRVGYESGSTLFVLLIAYGLLLQQRAYPMRLLHRLAALGCAVAAGGLVLMTGGRMNWVFTAFVLVVLAFSGRFRDRVRWLALGTAGAVCVVILLLRVLPFMFETIGALASTLDIREPHKLEASQSTMTRVYEFKNVHAQLVDHNSVVLGEGPGSVFSDKYHGFPFGFGLGDFPHREIVLREYQNTHSIVSNLMLNIGYGGLLIYLGCMTAFFFSCVATYRRTRNPSLQAIALALIVFLPVIVYMSWSSKTYILLGTFLGLVGSMSAVAARVGGEGGFVHGRR